MGMENLIKDKEIMNESESNLLQIQIFHDPDHVWLSGDHALASSLPLPADYHTQKHASQLT